MGLITPTLFYHFYLIAASEGTKEAAWMEKLLADLDERDENNKLYIPTSFAIIWAQLRSCRTPSFTIKPSTSRSGIHLYGQIWLRGTDYKSCTFQVLQITATVAR